MKQFTKTSFAMAAIFAMFFIAACDNGGTSPGGGASYLGNEGDAVEFISIDNGLSTYVLMQNSGIMASNPATGFYKKGETVPAGDLYVGASNKISGGIITQGAVVRVFRAGGAADSTNFGYKVVSNDGELNAANGTVYVVKPFAPAASVYTGAANAITVTGAATGDVYKLTEIKSDGSIDETYVQASATATVPATNNSKYLAERVALKSERFVF